MKTLTVFAFIILGFYLIGCIRPHVIISMKKYMDIYVKIFFIKFRVSTSRKFDPPDEELDLPKKKKKPEKPPKPKPTKEEKAEKKKKKPKKDKKMPKKPQPVLIGIDIPKMLEMVRNVLGAIFVKLFRYFRVRVKNFHIIVASDDAAKTAMLYGVICGYGDAILAILEKALDFKIENGAKVGADCDYTTEEMKIDMEIDISISLGGVFRYIFGIVGSALGGALAGLKLRLNKNYFAQKKKYKKDLAEYKVIKAEKDAKEAEKTAKEEEKAAKKAEKEKEKAANEAEKEKTEPEKTDEVEETTQNNIEINNDLMTEASERENNYEQQE
jgi:hypothetical protein